MAVDGDLARRAASPGFGAAHSPSPKRLRIALRRFSLVPDSCRSGSSSPRRSPRNVRLLRKARAGGLAHCLRNGTHSAVRHDECRRCRATGFPTAKSRPECRRGSTAEPNWPHDATRGLPQGTCHEDTTSRVHYPRTCAACQVGFWLNQRHGFVDSISLDGNKRTVGRRLGCCQRRYPRREHHVENG